MKAQYLYHSGDDISVVNAARVSFGRVSTVLTDADRSLIRYLASGQTTKEREKLLDQLIDCDTGFQAAGFADHLRKIAVHWVPFTHNSITLRMSAPVPIRTQCFKHKIGFTESEESRRYIDWTPEVLIPEIFRAAPPQGKSKQGSGEKHEKSDKYVAKYTKQVDKAIKLFDRMISDGICAEQARFVLPQGVIVNWIWTGNLAAYARYYNQRTDKHAQLESQQLAAQVGKIIQGLFPVSWAALTR